MFLARKIRLYFFCFWHRRFTFFVFGMEDCNFICRGWLYICFWHYRLYFFAWNIIHFLIMEDYSFLFCFIENNICFWHERLFIFRFGIEDYAFLAWKIYFFSLSVYSHFKFTPCTLRWSRCRAYITTFSVQCTVVRVLHKNLVVKF